MRCIRDYRRHRLRTLARPCASRWRAAPTHRSRSDAKQPASSTSVEALARVGVRTGASGTQLGQLGSEAVHFTEGTGTAGGATCSVIHRPAAGCWSPWRSRPRRKSLSLIHDRGFWSRPPSRRTAHARVLPDYMSRTRPARPGARAAEERQGTPYGCSVRIGEPRMSGSNSNSRGQGDLVRFEASEQCTYADVGACHERWRGDLLSRDVEPVRIFEDVGIAIGAAQRLGRSTGADGWGSRAPASSVIRKATRAVTSTGGSKRSTSSTAAPIRPGSARSNNA